jgi:predicted RNA-binding Zn ribbon-like protein
MADGASLRPNPTQMSPTAEAIIALLNTRPHSTFSEGLDDPAVALAVLRAFDPTADAVSARQLDEIRALRTELVAAAGSHDDAEVAQAWSDFTARTSGATFQHDFAPPGELRLRQVEGDPLVGAIAHAVAELLAAGTWPRVRICAYDVCSHAFYDTTRSRTQRWHAYEVCGNRSNVAAYRARRSSNSN